MLFEWIARELDPRPCSSAELLYDGMESQSGYCLPIIYRPFDCGKRSHWLDRGWILDYAESLHCGSKRILDFGPGDGWPSLPLSAFAASVTGVDSSLKRVQVCTENGKRMSAINAEFIHVPSGQPLPFKDNSYDGIAAASSIEQTPDPQATIAEFCRVLKPGGILRIQYEALGQYRGKSERELWLDKTGDNTCRLIFYDRIVSEERAVMYGLYLDIPSKAVIQALKPGSDALAFDDVSIDGLKALKKRVVDAKLCSLQHPSGKTYLTWLRQAGFSDVKGTCNGGAFAKQLFDQIPVIGRPASLEELDIMLRPLVKREIMREADISTDPAITTVK
ncbi:class I SAM-dependent methyltransferase [candidate division TA06 bacterium]|uniref:Class I SAM-dependent methyltransferase n=1 Tax=candidate division TA06 bacterium TaxID=2250710 RepID=A0A933IET3_UNCT6|nr:class I SAM-dependent methyltransferase [candidate division TA06 bacterium]